ncbi:hypothetical protein J6590_037905 [Homalodisca vitripennis]|nr:hypothetical protein J6590_037905 [Homalodisca vitripennis]
MSRLHDNARSHCGIETQNLIRSFGWKQIDHLLYSPDFVPSDFHLFRYLKEFLAVSASTLMRRLEKQLNIGHRWQNSTISALKNSLNLNRGPPFRAAPLPSPVGVTLPAT